MKGLIKQNGIRDLRLNIVLPIIFAAFLFVLLLLFDQSVLKDKATLLSSIVICFTLLISLSYAFFKYKTQGLNVNNVTALIIICGFFLRLAYVIRCGYGMNQHDVESLYTSGHLKYMYNLAMGEGLPDNNNWQFCHPPLHHALSAGVIKLSWALGMSNATAFENVQLLTCLYSTLTMFASNAILKECKIGEEIRLYSLSLLSFHPSMIIFSGSINNDILTVLLMLWAIYFLVKWYNKPSVRSALLCGLFTGLGMMSKFSAALIMMSAAIVVFYKFFKYKCLKIKELLIQILSFLSISLPLGMWHPVRNFLLFGQKIGHVAPINIDSGLYIGNVSLIKRLILPFSLEPVGVYVDVWEEYNLWNYLLRNSLFGEYSFGNEAVAAVAVLLNLVLFVLTIWALILIVRARFSNAFGVMPIITVAALQIISFIIFNINYPFGCSMDFRYIVPVLFCGAVLLGYGEQSAIALNSYSTKVFSAVLRFTTVAFCIASILVFI